MENQVIPENLELVPKLTEFETKYRAEPHLLTEFKRIMDVLPGLESFIYIEGEDDYFTNDHIVKSFIKLAESLKDKEAKQKLLKLITETISTYPPFMRYRRPSHGLDSGRTELTTKYKEDGAGNNFKREEKNLRVDKTEEETVKEFVKDLGYKLNFSVWKSCHIYKFPDAILVFYTVYDTTDGKASNSHSFMEIEVDEETVSTMTEAEAWAIIVKYEKALEPCGVASQRRMRKSLFELFKRDV